MSIAGDNSGVQRIEQYPDDMPGRVQEAEELLLFATVRVMRPSVLLLFGNSYGRNVRNLINAMGEFGELYSFDPLPAEEIDKCVGGRVKIIKVSPEELSPSTINGKRVDFVFLDGGYDLTSMQKIFVRLLPLLAHEAILAVHDTGVWHRREFARIHSHVQKSCSRAWLNDHEFQHHKDARLFVNWVVSGHPAFQPIHLHAQSCIRHGLTYLQRMRLLTTECDGVQLPVPAPAPLRIEEKGVAEISEIMPGVGDAVCINLKRRPERWSAFKNGAQRVGLSGIRRFEAVDGNDLTLPPGVDSHHGTFGCLHSHASAYEEALANGVSHLFVAEDDCVFLGTSESIRSYLAVTLGKFSWIHFDGSGRCYPEGMVRGDGFSSVTKVLNTHAYVVDRQLMELYVQWIRKTPFPMNELIHSDRLLPHLCKMHGLKICIPPKPLAKQNKTLRSDVTWGVPTRTKISIKQ